MRLNGTSFVLSRNPDMAPSVVNQYFLAVHPKSKLVNGIWPGLLVRPTRQSGGILEILFRDPSVDRGITLVNAIVDEYISTGLDEKNLATRNTLKFINSRLESLDTALRGAQNKVISFKSVNKIPNLQSEGNDIIQSTKDLDRTVAEQETQLSILKELERSLNNGDDYDLMPATLGFSEPTLGSLIAKHNELILARKQHLQNGKPSDPATIRFNELIEDSKRAIRENIKSVRSAFDIRNRDARAKLSYYDNQIAQLPAKEKELVDLERSARVIDQIYTFLLERREEAELTLAANNSNVRIIDRARNIGTSGGSATPVYILAIVISLLIPTIILILSELLNNKILEKKEIESRTNVPIIGEVGQVDNLEESIVITAKSRSSISEQFRLIRTNLNYYGVDGKLGAALVTSHIAGEGKSFVSLNLAASMALTNKRVVILEFDLRKPKISKYLHMQKGIQGISNYAVDMSLTPADIIYPIEGKENMFIVPCGPIPPNPAELILSQRIDDMFAYLKDNFDLVIIDSPPVGMVADA
ncbi:MAG TPA: GNVR domain-containing protein, partial [Phnomibacter sp.]|nr:GNVR domain-containing protein [Phnomibacter sp.]